MRNLLLLTLLCLVGPVLHAILPLEQTYGSGIYDDQQLDLLTWSDREDSLIYYDNSSVQAVQMQEDDFGTGWNSGTIALPDHDYIGFRGLADNLRINPIFWDLTSAPPLAQYTLVETDPVGDHLFTANYLDILAFKASFSSERLYFAIDNNDTEFPTSSDASFFAYMVVLVDPAADPDQNPIVFGLMYTVDLGTLIGPGLFKITGTGVTDLTRIGNIEHSVDPQTGMLVLSCALSDLTADADFNSWYDPDYPEIATSAMTSRITLTSGSQESDATGSARIIFKPQLLPTANAFAPTLENPSSEYMYLDDQYIVRFHIIYTDADPNFPRVAEFLLDGGGTYQLHPVCEPQDLDFSSAVTFRTEGILLAPPWNGQFRFSHGDDFIYRSLDPVAIHDDLMPGFCPSIYPNPTRGSISIDTGTKLDGTLNVTLYNLRGQNVGNWSFTSTETEPLSLDLSPLTSGIYYLRLHDSRGDVFRRFVKLD